MIFKTKKDKLIEHLHYEKERLTKKLIYEQNANYQRNTVTVDSVNEEKVEMFKTILQQQEELEKQRKTIAILTKEIAQAKEGN